MGDGIALFNRILNKFWNRVFRRIVKYPSYIPAYARVLSWQAASKRRRQRNAAEGLTVPPIMIFSITNRCNLNCVGCFAHAQGRKLDEELSISQIEDIIAQGEALGISIFLIAGGEPLVKKGILELPSRFKGSIFSMFTNGTLIDGSVIASFRQSRNIFPVLSIEGHRALTDMRRGSGVYSGVMKAVDDLYENRIIFGMSITVTQSNFNEVFDKAFLKEFCGKGCLAFFFIEYVPLDNNLALCLTDAQRSEMTPILESLQASLGVEMIALPGEEEVYGGCLAAGRGFVHVSSSGSLEACPFAPFSDISLKNIGLKQALESKLLKKIREHHDMLTESVAGCALWENRAWVEEQLESK